MIVGCEIGGGLEVIVLGSDSDKRRATGGRSGQVLTACDVIFAAQLNASEKTPYDFLVEEGPVVYPGEGPK